MRERGSTDSTGDGNTQCQARDASARGYFHVMLAQFLGVMLAAPFDEEADPVDIGFLGA
jgi:hypothetical protein